jgi:Flp pilus assembly protein TadD
MTRFFLLFLLILITGTGCTLPRLIVLNDPLDARQHNDLGVAYEARGDPDLAEREYQRAAELDWKWARPLINLGNVHASRQDWAAAEQSLTSALEREGENSEAMNNLAWIQLQAGRPADALPWARRAVSQAPTEPAYLDTLADIQAALGDLDGARESLRRALAFSPPAPLAEILKAKIARLRNDPAD